MKEGKKVIASISKAEFRNRAIMYLTILLLFLADLILIALVISKSVGSGN